MLNTFLLHLSAQASTSRILPTWDYIHEVPLTMRAHQQDNSLISRTNKNGQNKPGLKTQKISLWYSPPGLPLSQRKKKRCKYCMYFMTIFLHTQSFANYSLSKFMSMVKIRPSMTETEQRVQQFNSSF